MIKSIFINIFIYNYYNENNNLKMRFNKKRKNIDAIASTSYVQILNEHAVFIQLYCEIT